MTALHIESRPWVGHVPPPAPDPARTAAGALAAARHKLATPAVEHPPACPCVWCRDEWVYADGVIGPCEGCGEPCRSTDPEGRRRHPSRDCGVAG